MVVVIVLWAATVIGCQSQRDGALDGKLRVAVSIPPQAWLVEQIGGPRVETLIVVRPSDSHETYQPSDAEIARIRACAVWFRIGIPLENARGLQGLVSQSKLRLVDTHEGIPLREMTPLERGGEALHQHQAPADKTDAHEETKHLHDDTKHASETPTHAHAGEKHVHDKDHHHGHHDHSGKDPHVWLSPRILKIQARTIAKTLAELDPPHRAEYEANLASLQEKLDKVDAEIRRILEPWKGRMFLVFHPAWGYFADDYGLKQVAIEIEGKDPSDEEATALQRLARREGIKVVFVQPQISSRGAEAMARAIGARVETIDPLVPNISENLVRVAQAIAASFE